MTNSVSLTLIILHLIIGAHSVQYKAQCVLILLISATVLLLSAKDKVKLNIMVKYHVV